MVRLDTRPLKDRGISMGETRLYTPRKEVAPHSFVLAVFNHWLSVLRIVNNEETYCGTQSLQRYQYSPVGASGRSGNWHVCYALLSICF